MSRRAAITLGRDGMGDATEEDFEAWCAWVAARIDDATGLDCSVDERSRRDVQSNGIYVDGTEDSDPAEDRAVVVEALAALWESWCSDGASLTR